MKKVVSTKKQFNIGIIPMTLILAVITFIFIMVVSKVSSPTTINKIGTESKQTEQVTRRITNTQGLDEALSELDSNNPSSLNTDLNAVSNEASGF